jgi:hypothetical protein
MKALSGLILFGLIVIAAGCSSEPPPPAKVDPPSKMLETKTGDKTSMSCRSNAIRFAPQILMGSVEPPSASLKQSDSPLALAGTRDRLCLWLSLVCSSIHRLTVCQSSNFTHTIANSRTHIRPLSTTYSIDSRRSSYGFLERRDRFSVSTHGGW